LNIVEGNALRLASRSGTDLPIECANLAVGVERFSKTAAAAAA
jgi:hypothetical protein